MRKLHRWLGIALAIPLLWIATTGILLGLARSWTENQAPHRLPPQLLSPAPGGASIGHPLRKAALGRILTRVEEAGMLPSLRGVKFAEAADRSHRVSFSSGEAWYFAPTGTLPFEKHSAGSFDPVSFLTSLHRGKILGTPGRALFSLVALLLLVLTASSWSLIRFRKPWRKPRDLHRWSGVAALLPFSVLLLSGGLWNFSTELRALPPLPAGPAAPLAPQWTGAFDAAEPWIMSSEAEGMYFTGGRILVLLADSTRIYSDPSDPMRQEVRRPWTARGWIEPLFSIHSGRAFGPAGIWAVLATGILALVLSGTGAYVFWKTSRRGNQGRNQSRKSSVIGFRSKACSS